MDSKIIAIDFDKNSQHIRFNTNKKEYFVYNIDNFKDLKKIEKPETLKIDQSEWATHTLPFSP